MRAVTFDCTMFNSAAARFMLPILATASTILKSSASMCVLPPHASIETNLFPISPFPQHMYLDSVVAGISALSPVVFWFFRDVRNSGDRFHILQTKFHGHKQTERRSMLHCKGLTIEVCDEQRL